MSDNETIPANDQAPSTPNRETIQRDLGARLKAAREERGESIDTVVRELKLRRVYIEALEAGDWTQLPDEVYALGFLKQYAAHLELDVGPELEQLRGEGVRLTRPLTYPDPPVAPSRRWAWIAGAAFIVLFIAFNLGSSDNDEPATRSPATQSPAVPTTQDDARAVAAPEPSNLSGLKKRLDAAPVALPDLAQSSASSEPAAPTPSQAAAPAPAAEARGHRFVLEAVDEPVWVQVYLSDPYTGDAPAEHPIREALLQPGQHLRLKQPAPRIWVTTGNAGALQIRMDSEIAVAAGQLGRPAQVRHKVPLPPLLDSGGR